MTSQIERAFGAWARALVKRTGGCFICEGRYRNCLVCHGRAWKRLHPVVADDSGEQDGTG